MNMMETTSPVLAERRDRLRAAEPNLRARDLARRLGISEAELVALEGQCNATPLRPAFPDLIARLGGLGPVMALTRNEHAVHEKIGRYEPASQAGETGLVLGQAIDLRIFYSQWRFGFAVTESSARGPRRSLQFFDARGTAVHKVYLTEESDAEAYIRLIADFGADAAPLDLEVRAEPTQPTAADEVDAAEFRAAWDRLQDTHDFHRLLAAFGLQRVQALRLAGRTRARPLGATALRDTLTRAAEQQLPIMVFVANPGVVQIHSGPVRRVLATGPWFNVLDDDFNLHLRESAIASSWTVAKPTADGVVTSLELFDAEGGMIAMLFGTRKPGQAENPQWRGLLATLPEAISA
jgi:putative hemin transport protein